MRRLFLGGLLTFLLPVFSTAQSKNSGLRFGLSGGVNYSGVSNAHRPSGPRYSFQGGGVVLLSLSKSEQYFLQAEALYYGAGETGKDKDFKNGDREVNGYNAVYNNSYLSIPVYFKYYFNSSPSGLFAMGGPRFNILLNEKVKNVPVERPYYDPNYQGVSPHHGKASSFNFGIGLGLGYSIKKELEFTLRYDQGLSNTYKGLVNELSSSNKSESVFSVGASYIFK